MKALLVEFATDNSIEYKDLLTDKNEESVKKYLSSLRSAIPILKTLDKNNVQKTLLDIYSGSYQGEGDLALDRNTQSLVRAEVDVLCSMVDVTYEDLLTTPEYAEELLDCTDRLQRLTLFADEVANCKDYSSIITSIIKDGGVGV